jgi:hypothetical protein
MKANFTNFVRPEGTVTRREELVPGMVVFKTYLHIFEVKEAKIIRAPVKYSERLLEEDRINLGISAIDDTYWYKALVEDHISWFSCGDANIEDGGYNTNYLFLTREAAETAVADFLRAYGPGPHYIEDPW